MTSRWHSLPPPHTLPGSLLSLAERGALFSHDKQTPLHKTDTTCRSSHNHTFRPSQSSKISLKMASSQLCFARTPKKAPRQPKQKEQGRHTQTRPDTQTHKHTNMMLGVTLSVPKHGQQISHLSPVSPSHYKHHNASAHHISPPRSLFETVAGFHSLSPKKLSSSQKKDNPPTSLSLSLSLTLFPSLQWCAESLIEEHVTVCVVACWRGRPG